ncbi:trypsin-like peptidase domain-containing protein [Marivita sp. S6314]|uniref:trypsin-like serine peptidase n=1 Tax=Marivita sp. S6314 TaxID=2926406 RepID=UPI001FF373D2|nr:trypsin-like peptidase domain-containing protein [Marivita sp. S6314]MCK0148596.1 trypsin-like peptidase domain-containing protein [Marivita sp. S6314]
MKFAIPPFVLTCLAVSASAQELPVLPVDKHENWQAIGRVNAAGFRKREMCSGTLIAADTVLTAAHCLAGTDGIGPKPEEFTFVAGWLQGEAVDSVRGAAVWVHPDAYVQGVLDIRYDIALLTLDRPAQVTPLPLATAPTSDNFGVLGYSTRRPHMLGAAFDCTGTETSHLLRLSCPVTPGNSGGPVVTKVGDSWQIAAVISAMGQSGALAVPVSRLPAP